MSLRTRRGRASRLIVRLGLAIALPLAVLTAIAGASTQASAATTTKVAYVTDFGAGLNDSTGVSPGPPGSSIFTNAITGTPLSDGGTYNGATFTDVSVSSIDSGGISALAGYDTVVLYEVCDIASHPATLSAVNTFLENGGKVMIFDADRCASIAAGQADWSGFLFPFSTNSVGPLGEPGPYTFIESSPLTTGLSLGVQQNDAVGDANVFTTAAGGWCKAILATNANGANSDVMAYARTTGGGLAVYEGEDFWFTDTPDTHLQTVFNNMLNTSWNPDSLPCANPATGIKLDPPTATNQVGSSQTETATVVDTSATPESGVTVTFNVTSGPDAGMTGTGVTDASGQATFTYTNTTGPGVDDVVASFTDANGTHDSNTSVITWTKQPTGLSYTGATTGEFDDPATLSATLLDSNNAAIVGQTVDFTMGAESCTGITDPTGNASCTITPSEAAGTYPLTATFGGTSKYLPATFSGTFTVTKEETALSYTGPTIIANGSTTSLSAALTEASDFSGDGTGPIAGRTVDLTLGTGAGAQSCSGVTDASGVATCPIGPVNQPLGPGDPITASFAGDGFYLPSNAASSALLFDFTNGGSFVVGNSTAGTPPTTGTAVHFWSSQWEKHNSLSGGGAPASFKGFEDDPTTPACGVGWTTDPGNSTPPPATVPAYTAVIVASHVSKSGPTISGDTVNVVIVQTDPGYGPAPGHPGKGTIVATFC